MEAGTIVLVIIAIGILAPVALFWLLVNAIANRIAGKNVNAEEFKQLKTRVAQLEQQLNDARLRISTVEETSDFSKKMLEDVMHTGITPDDSKASLTRTPKGDRIKD